MKVDLDAIFASIRPRWSWSPKTGNTNWIMIDAALESGDEERVREAMEYLKWYYSIHKPEEGESASQTK